MTRGEIEYILDKLVEVIYPKRCLLCDDLLRYGETRGICPSCLSSIKFLKSDLCKICGKPLTNHLSDKCFDCQKGFHFYNQGRALWLYEGSIKEAIHRYKYYNRKDYGRQFGQELLKYYLEFTFWDIDYIVPIPLHKNRLKTRGYNQAKIMAKYLGKKLEIPVLDRLLYRTKETKPQKELSDKDRILNVKDAFTCSGQATPIDGNILLVDDIYTTGNTIDNAAKVLKENGARYIYYIALAIGKGF